MQPGLWADNLDRMHLIGRKGYGSALRGCQLPDLLEPPDARRIVFEPTIDRGARLPANASHDRPCGKLAWRCRFTRHTGASKQRKAPVGILRQPVDRAQGAGLHRKMLTGE